jgi:hypothetical protein
MVGKFIYWKYFKLHITKNSWVHERGIDSKCYWYTEILT